MDFLKTEFVLQYADGTEARFAVPERDGESTFSDGITAVSARRGERLLETVLTAISEKPLRFADWELFLPPEMRQGDVRVFRNGCTTNDSAQVLRREEMIGVTTREILLLARCDETPRTVIGASFVSADRFWTWICPEEDRVILRHWMEEKPLRVGEGYRLEQVLLGKGGAEAQLTEYAARMAARYPHPRREIPTGWCSWSCWYKNVNQQNILAANRELDTLFARHHTGLVQIDDGWQRGNSFCGTFLENRDTFPDGLGAVAAACNRSGRTFGLWLSPLLAAEGSELLREQPQLKKTIDTQGETDEVYRFGEIPVYALDLAKEETLAHLREKFSRCRREYGARYFKLDFLIPALQRISFRRECRMRYEGDYLTAVYRRALQTIRDAVGEDAFLLACGAPIADGAGIFDAIRVTPDITWGKSKDYPKQWELIKMCTRSILCRFFYHPTLFLNDPDALLVRDEDRGDGFDCTYHEARTWATGVAMSGGSVLINEELARLGPARMELAERVFPPLGAAARPVDFFELPQPSKAYIPLPDGRVLAAVYHYGDQIGSEELGLAAVGAGEAAMVMRTWDGGVAGLCRGTVFLRDMMPHSAEVLCISPVRETPSFAFSDCNLYGGAGLFTWAFDGETLAVFASPELAQCRRRAIFLHVPPGWEADRGTVALRTEAGCLLRLSAEPGQTERIGFRRTDPA